MVSRRGSNETKETVGTNGFFLSRQWRFCGIAANPMTSDPCQLKLTIEGFERSSRHDLGSIDTDLKPMQQSTPATAMPSNDNFRTCICKNITPLDTCWPIVRYFEQFWASLSNYEQLWAILSSSFFGPAWVTILSTFAGQVWVMSSNSEQFLEARYGIVELG